MLFVVPATLDINKDGSKVTAAPEFASLYQEKNGFGGLSITT
jgi:hypothetical protein